MNTILKCVCALTLLKLVPSAKIAIVIFPPVNEEANNQLMRSGSRIDGIFTNFLTNLFNWLPNIPRRKLKEYCKMAAEEMYRLEYKQTRKLAKHIRYLARMDGYDLQAEIAMYKELLEDMAPVTRDFLEAMNQVFTPQHDARFKDYVNDLGDYARNYKIVLKDETRSILEMIIDAVQKMGLKDQIDIEKKLKKAVKEYQKGDLRKLFGINPPPEPVVTLQ